MSEANATSGEQIASLVTRFAALTWPVPEAEVPTLIDTLGWSVTNDSLDGIWMADSGWPINRPDAEFTCVRGELNSLSVTVTDVVLEETPWREEFLRDAFADIVTAATQALGAPSRRTSGERGPLVEWGLANGGLVTAVGLSVAVSMTVDSARYAEARRHLEREERLSDDGLDP